MENNKEMVLKFDEYLRTAEKKFTYHGLMEKPEEDEWLAYSYKTNVFSLEEEIAPNIFKDILEDINIRFPNRDIKLFGYEMFKTLLVDEYTKIDPKTGVILSYRPESVKNMVTMRLGFKKSIK